MGMDRPGVRQVPEGSGEQGRMEKTGCKIICGAPTTLAVKGLMMMMMSEDRVLTLHQERTHLLSLTLLVSTLSYSDPDTGKAKQSKTKQNHLFGVLSTLVAC